jgi:hypothetical protein
MLDASTGLLSAGRFYVSATVAPQREGSFGAMSSALAALF